ncbi:MAG: DUF1553 domain-containing protein [Pirellulaceae bacterium]|nr:DUF1553 domain-containing protein [Pirellulaceae bacterium]
MIDEQIDARLRELNIQAAEVSADEEFFRRAHLDLTGVIPLADDVGKFLADTDGGKRTALIDRLLSSPAHAAHMATVFDVMLMERRPDKYVTTEQWRQYLTQSFADNKPLNELAGEILGSDGVDEKLRPAAKFFLDRAVDKDSLVRDIGRLMLGVDLQCAQCHDHLGVEDYLHEHYHGLSVFVAGSKTFKQPDGTLVLQETAVREVEFASVFDPDKARKTGPRLLAALMELPAVKEGEEYVEKPSRTVRAVPKFSLRKLLSKRLPSDETPEFARNMANRLWAQMMGRGLVHPLDMHHSGNAASHPELLELLSQRLRSTHYDVRSFLREIALSRAYARSSMAPEGADAEQIPPDSYAVANMKGLTAEQLFESLLRATGSEELLAQQIDQALAEAESSESAAASEDEKADRAALAAAERAARVKEFVTLFGGVAGTPAGEFQASLPQALFFANSETIVSWVEPAAGNLTERLAAIDDVAKTTEDAYLQVLSRLPGADERTAAEEYLNAAVDRRAAVRELVWSLVAAAEFRFNH